MSLDDNSDTLGYNHARYVSCLTSICVPCINISSLMMMKEREKNPVPEHSLLPSISTQTTARLNVSICRTNRYQQYNMSSQHMYCERVWNLIQALDVQSSDQKLYIFTPPSSRGLKFSYENFRPHWVSNSGSAESEADMLPQASAADLNQNVECSVD